MTQWYKCHGCWCQVKKSKAKVVSLEYPEIFLFCSNKCAASYLRGMGLEPGIGEGLINWQGTGEHGLNEFYGRNFEEPPRVPDWAKATAWAMIFTTWGLALAIAAQWAFGA